MQKSVRKRIEKEAYLRVSRELLARRGHDRVADGRRLVQQCLDELRTREGREREEQWNFPPQLFIVFATVSFRPFEDLLAGIKEELNAAGLLDVPVIGCSVAGVLTEKDVLLKGAALVCIASRRIRARVAFSPDALHNCENAVASLCKNLGLAGDDLNPDGNRFLLCFLPGFVKVREQKFYKAFEIHAALLRATKGAIPMVGGAAGDDFLREDCCLFVNQTVKHHNAAVALVESDLRFGIGMLHGLQATGEFLQTLDVSEGGHRIARFGRIRGGELEVATPAEVLEDYRRQKRRILLASVAPEEEAERIVLSPVPDANGSVFVARKTKELQPLEVLECSPAALRNTPTRTIESTLCGAQIDPFHLALALRFPCATRFKYAEEIGLDVEGALADMRGRFPDLPIVAGLMYGEIGQEPSGRNLMRNWSVSNLLLTDELHPRSLHRRSYQVLAEASEKAANAGAESVSAVISLALDALVEAGFPGAMISLLFHDKRSYVIVAQDARGTGWEKVKELTRRRGTEKDTLVVVAKRRTPQFTPDARIGKYDDQKAVKAGNVISYFVAPLVAPDRQVIGAVQVGLGDMSNLSARALPRYMQTLLEAFANQIATAISGAIRMHELRLSELFDRAVKACLVKDTVREAAQEFIDVIVADQEQEREREGKKLLASHMVHIRLLDKSGRFLELVAGAGEYFVAAIQHRPRVTIDDKSPTAKAFRSRKSIWVNDTLHDPESQKFIDSLDSIPELFGSLRDMGSYANLLIRAEDSDMPIGVITIASWECWFFSESIWRSMQTLGERLYFALDRAKRVETEREQARKISFLLGMAPPLGAKHLRTALRDHAERIAVAAGVEVVSFFLWDPEIERFVLRGQFGWKDGSLVGKASYRPGQGMTGSVSEEALPQYIPDLRKWKSERPEQRRAKYEQEMFGQKLENVRYEVIAVPLGVSRPVGILGMPRDETAAGVLTSWSVQVPLGILTMKNAIGAGGPESKFATRDQVLLKEVRDKITTFLAASLAHEDTERRKREEARIGELAHLLLKPVPDTYEFARRVCRHLVDTYRVEGCALYLPHEREPKLCLGGPPCFARCHDPNPSIPRAGQEVLLPNTVVGTSLLENKAFTWNCSQSKRDDLDSSVQWAEPLLGSRQIDSVIVQPLRDFTEGPVGVLVAWNARDRAPEEHPWFTKVDQHEFGRAGEFLARALDQQRKTREEQWMLFLGTIRTRLAHLVSNRIRLVNTDLNELSEELGTPRAKPILEAIRSKCEYVLGEMGRCMKTADRVEPKPYQELNLIEVLRSAVESCLEKAATKGIDIVIRRDGAIWTRGDDDQLQCVFHDLIDNGINAMESGELTLDVTLNEDTQDCCVEIIDEGRGMTPQLIERLLRRPRELTSDRRVPLGVALAKFVIEHHGGELDFESVVGRGVTALVTLPYVRTA